MNQPTPGLRPLFNRSNSTQRVELFIAAGDELAVSDDVAAQLPAAFAPVGDTSKDDAAAARAQAAEAAGEQVLVGEQGPEVVDMPSDGAVKPAAKKRPKG